MLGFQKNILYENSYGHYRFNIDGGIVLPM
jgi:hypothetical protein